MPEGLDKLAGAIGDTLKTAPTLYEDALQPTIQEVGKFVARIPRAINAAFAGLDKWILNKEYAIDETKKLLEKKLENVDPDKIVEPEAYVAVPAIQAISYSMNSEELRNLYANLLAKAMNSDTKDLVHPSFVEIIKQMSPTDALILKEINLNYIIPFLRRSSKFDNYNATAQDPVLQARTNTTITLINFAKQNEIDFSLFNLLRLGLIEDSHITVQNQEFEKLINCPNAQEYLKTFQIPAYEILDFFYDSYYTLSSLGINMSQVCLDE